MQSRQVVYQLSYSPTPKYLLKLYCLVKLQNYESTKASYKHTLFEVCVCVCHSIHVEVKEQLGSCSHLHHVGTYDQTQVEDFVVWAFTS